MQVLEVTADRRDFGSGEFLAPIDQMKRGAGRYGAFPIRGKCKAINVFGWER